jgi:predicted nucleic acid-binding protein
VPVVDASVVVDWVIPPTREDHPAVVLLNRWVAAGTQPVCPSLAYLEVRNALLTGIRRARWDGADADASTRLLDALPLRRQDAAADVRRAWELARRHDNWPVYDMVYVALAERLGEPLVTQDVRLLRRLAASGLAVGPSEA